MENLYSKERFKIFTGKKVEGKLLYEKQSGDAYWNEECPKPHYLIKMWALGRESYYLCKNRGDEFRYTLFSKKVGDDASPTFRRPIGFGTIRVDMPTYLEIQFLFPRQRVFVSLYPATHEEDESTAVTEEKLCA